MGSKRHRLTKFLVFAIAASALSSARAEDLPFVFQGVPQVAPAGSAFGGYELIYGRRATPPLGPDGVEHRWFAGVHILPGLSFKGHVSLMTREHLSGQAVRAGIDTRITLLDRDRSGLDLGFTAGYAREVGTAHVAVASIQAAGMIGPIEVASTALVEKAFARGRDAADVIVTWGASLPLTRMFSLGIEYVGQDIEDLWEKEEAEGGARHLLGPAATFRFLNDKVQAGAGAGVGLTRNSPDLVAQASLVINW